jgi:hypothetical protein
MYAKPSLNRFKVPFRRYMGIWRDGINILPALKDGEDVSQKYLTGPIYAVLARTGLSSL